MAFYVSISTRSFHFTEGEKMSVYIAVIMFGAIIGLYGLWVTR